MNELNPHYRRGLTYYKKCHWCGGKGAYPCIPEIVAQYRGIRLKDVKIVGWLNDDEAFIECHHCRGMGYKFDRIADSLKDIFG